MTTAPKIAPPQGLSVFHMKIYMKISQNLLLKNHKAHSFDIWYVASSNGPLPSLFKLCPPGQNLPRPGAYPFCIGKSLIIVCSETTKPRALIFGMWHHLITLYQICSNLNTRAPNGPALGIISFT